MLARSMGYVLSLFDTMMGGAWRWLTHLFLALHRHCADQAVAAGAEAGVESASRSPRCSAEGGTEGKYRDSEGAYG